MNTLTTTIRIADPDADFAHIAELRTMCERYPVTAGMLHEDENRMIEGKIRRMSVAEDGGQIAGYSYAVHYPSQKPGSFNISIAVDPDMRNSGHGSVLYRDVLSFVLEQGASLLYCEVREQDRDAIRFAQKRGFTISNHAIESVLDLSTFDESRFAGLLEAVEATGVRFITFADAGDTPENRYKLYAINRIASADDPASPEGTFPTFENWCRLIPQASDFQPEGQILAADGDMYVGLAAISYYKDAGSAESLLTGVHPNYRHRKIAQALKLLTVRFARARGARYITTENDSRNIPMLAINRKLGYKFGPGYYSLVSDPTQVRDTGTKPTEDKTP